MLLSRTSLTLSDITLLRGTTPAVLLESFGNHLSSSSGDDGTYCKSFSVCTLDYFLSHSWHAPWKHKFATLLIYFNGVAACIGCCSGACGLGLYMGASTVNLDRFNWAMGEAHLVLQLYAFLLIGILVTYWSKVRSCLCFRPLSIFLDKVCIHQSDSTLKVEGIKSIGGILASTNCLLIVWDRSYFTRLWCVYEIAAFLHSKPQGRILLLPVRSGYFTMVLSVISFLVAVLDGLASRIRRSQRNSFEDPESVDPESVDLEWVKYAQIALQFVFSMLVSFMSWGYVEELTELEKQLATFSSRNSNCFCCSVGHVHPETDAALPCDRKLVYGSIRYWYQGSCEAESLASFDNLVRKKIKGWLLQGPAMLSVIPYSFLCFISCPLFCGRFYAVGYMQFFDHTKVPRLLLYFNQKYILVVALTTLECALLRLPLLIALWLWIHMRFHAALPYASPIARTCGMFFLSSIFPIVHSVIESIMHPLNFEDLRIFMCCVVMEVLMAWIIFGRTNRRNSSNDCGGHAELVKLHPVTSS